MTRNKNLYDYVGIIAMLVTPLAVAVLFGWELHQYLRGQSVPMSLAIAGGIAGAMAVECVGIYAGHVSMDYIRRRDWRALIAVAAMVVYVWFGYSKVGEYGLMFVLAAFVYALVALRQEAVSVDTAVLQKDQAQLAHERKMEMEKLHINERVRLARIDVKIKQEPAQNGRVPAQSQLVPALGGHVCHECERPFTSVQALNAHRRFCSGRVASNGNGRSAGVAQ